LSNYMSLSEQFSFCVHRGRGNRRPRTCTDDPQDEEAAVLACTQSLRDGAGKQVVSIERNPAPRERM